LKKLFVAMQVAMIQNARIIRALQYTSFMIGAMLTFVWPSVIVTGTLASLSGAWSILFAVSSLICLLGTLTRTWVGEYIGLWGVLPCLVLYAIGCFTDPLFPLRAGFGLLFFGFALGKYARLLEVRSQAKMALVEAKTQRVMGR